MSQNRRHQLTRDAVYVRLDNARAMSAAERDRARADAADETVCTCGWITARDVCPICGCVRVPDELSPG